MYEKIFHLKNYKFLNIFNYKFCYILNCYLYYLILLFILSFFFDSRVARISSPLEAWYFLNYVIRRSAAIATPNIIRSGLFEEKIMPMKMALPLDGSHVAASLLLLLVRKERQTKVVLESKERGGRRPIIIREEIHSRADSHRRYLPKEKRDAPFCTLRKNFQSPLLSLLTPLTRQWLRYKRRAKIKIFFFPCLSNYLLLFSPVT